MNALTRAHFHLRITEVLSREKTARSFAASPREYIDWTNQLTALLRELQPLLEPAIEPVQPAATLRDKIAVAAMQAAATNPTGADGFTFEQRADWAYAQADAMLATRNKEPNK